MRKHRRRAEKSPSPIMSLSADKSTDAPKFMIFSRHQMAHTEFPCGSRLLYLILRKSLVRSIEQSVDGGKNEKLVHKIVIWVKIDADADALFLLWWRSSRCRMLHSAMMMPQNNEQSSPLVGCRSYHCHAHWSKFSCHKSGGAHLR